MSEQNTRRASFLTSTSGQLVAAGNATNAIPAFANIDPPRMFRVPVR
jgi:hypothetical protein